MSGGARPRILFIARAFPPTVGGMENFALRLSDALGAHADVSMLVNHWGKRGLPLFLPYAFAEAVRRTRRVRFDAIHLADALPAPLGVMLKRATGLPVTASIHGLDVTYPNRLYQTLVPRALVRLDMTMANSAATDEDLRARTHGRARSIVIPLGVNPLPAADAAAAGELRRWTCISSEAPMVLTVGRLIRRKGAAWFAGNVLPHLPGDAVYAVVGTGPEDGAIREAARAAGVADRLRMLGSLGVEDLAAAYAAADVFVMPNVPVAGDIEGFGLVALEAAASGLPVVASRLEGITEALRNGSNGALLPPGDATAYVGELSALLAMSRDERGVIGARAAAYTRERYGWDRTAREYVTAMRSVVHPRVGESWEA